MWGPSLLLAPPGAAGEVDPGVGEPAVSASTADGSSAVSPTGAGRPGASGPSPEEPQAHRTTASAIELAYLISATKAPPRPRRNGNEETAFINANAVVECSANYSAYLACAQ